MTSDLERALAFVARRQASRAMPAQRWAHVLSFELGWMNPGQARTFVQRGVDAGLLAPDGGVHRLVIDPAAVELPRGFRPKVEESAAASSPTPAPAMTTEPAADAGPSTLPPARPPRPPGTPAPPDLFLTWVARLAAQRGLTRDQVLGQVADLQESMGGLLTGEAAVLLLARRNGTDIAATAGEAEAAMLAPAHSQPKR